MSQREVMILEPRRTKSHYKAASLAQLVEQVTLNHWVAGSSPAGSTENKQKTPLLPVAFFVVPNLYHFCENTRLHGRKIKRGFFMSLTVGAMRSLALSNSSRSNRYIFLR